MASSYFYLISEKLHTYAKEYDEDLQAKLKLYKLDTEFLSMFCSCVEIAVSYNQSNKISFRSVITHLKRIWIVQVVEEDNKLDDDDDIETWPKDIQDFDPLTFGLERKIEQSKPQIEQWCQILVRSSSMEMQFMSSTNLSINVLGVYHKVCDLLKYRAAEIVPFKNQIEILKDMLDFLIDSWLRIYKSIDSKELLELL